LVARGARHDGRRNGDELFRICNRASETKDGALTTYTRAPSSNRLASLTGATAKTFSYDAAGNQTGDGTLTWAYDAHGRMSSTSGDRGSATLPPP
jgi:hypothetical protein